MKINPTLSIVVPIYNRENTLSVCLNSLISIPDNDIEIILINDGSTDHSLQIANKFAEKDSRVLVFSQVNSGVGTARNAGINNARGKWITFVDSDDAITPTVLSVFRPYFDREDIDLLIAGGDYCNYNGFEAISLAKKHRIIEQKEVLGNLNLIHYLFGEYQPYKNALCPCVSKFFKRKILEQSNMRFRTDVNLGEDQIFLYDYLVQCKGLYYNNSPWYLQFTWTSEQRPTSLVRTLRDPNNFFFNYLANVEALKKMDNHSNDILVHTYYLNYVLDRPLRYIVCPYIRWFNIRKIGYQKLKNITEIQIKPIIQENRLSISDINEPKMKKYCQILDGSSYIKFFLYVFVKENYLFEKGRIRKFISRQLRNYHLR
jgi:glycosyltransferase involved in cell wall biosynthesis